MARAQELLHVDYIQQIYCIESIVKIIIILIAQLHRAVFIKGLHLVFTEKVSSFDQLETLDSIRFNNFIAKQWIISD